MNSTSGNIRERHRDYLISNGKKSRKKILQKRRDERLFSKMLERTNEKYLSTDIDYFIPKSQSQNTNPEIISMGFNTHVSQIGESSRHSFGQTSQELSSKIQLEEPDDEVDRLISEFNKGMSMGLPKENDSDLLADGIEGEASADVEFAEQHFMEKGICLADQEAFAWEMRKSVKSSSQKSSNKEQEFKIKQEKK